MAIPVLIADGHKMMRDGLRSILRQDATFEVIAEAGDGAEAVQMWRERRPELSVMSVGLPGLNGIEATVAILREDGDARIVLLASNGDDEQLVEAAQSGARGLLLKRSSERELIDTMRRVAGGGWALGPVVARILIDRRRAGGTGDATLNILSPRERQVLRLVAEGKSSKEIATLLHLEVQTIRSYRKAMMLKLGVGNAADATRMAMKGGLMRDAGASAAVSARTGE